MIDQELTILADVSSMLRQHIENISIIEEFMEGLPSDYPCVYVYQSSNVINEKYRTFDTMENVVIEVYTCEIFSNLNIGRKQQIKEITDCINVVMEGYGYVRTYNEPTVTKDKSVSKKVVKYTKENLTGGQ